MTRVPNGLASGYLVYTRLVCGDTELAYSLAGTTLAQVLEAGAGFTFGMANQMLGRTEMALGKLAEAQGTPGDRRRRGTPLGIRLPADLAPQRPGHS